MNNRYVKREVSIKGNDCLSFDNDITVIAWTCEKIITKQSTYVLLKSRETHALIAIYNFRQFAKQVSFFFVSLKIVFAVICWKIIVQRVQAVVSVKFVPYFGFRRFVQTNFNIGNQLYCAFIKLDGLVKFSALLMLDALEK